MLRPADGLGRVDLDDLADDEPVVEHADGRQVLLDRGRGHGLAQLLDVGRDVVALDVPELEAAVAAPGEEPPGVAVVGRPSIRVPDIVGEEGEESLGGPLAELGDDGRDDGGGGRLDLAAGSRSSDMVIRLLAFRACVFELLGFVLLSSCSHCSAEGRAPRKSAGSDSTSLVT